MIGASEKAGSVLLSVFFVFRGPFVTTDGLVKSQFVECSMLSTMKILSVIKIKKEGAVAWSVFATAPFLLPFNGSVFAP